MWTEKGLVAVVVVVACINVTVTVTVTVAGAALLCSVGHALSFSLSDDDGDLASCMRAPHRSPITPTTQAQ